MEMLREVGIQDPGGELASRDVDAGLKPFQRRMINEKGTTLDGAAEKAMQAGYIPAYDQNLLLEAIDAELAGNPVYSAVNTNADLMSVQMQMYAIEEMLSEQGINLDDITDFDLKRMITNDTSKIFTQPEIGSNYTESGVSFTQDLGDQVVTEDVIEQETGEEITIETPVQALFDDMVERRKGLDELITCLGS